VTIRKGAEWGTLRVPAADTVVVRSDAELRALLVAARRDGSVPGVIALLGGDLMRTVGGSGDATRLRTGEPIPHLPVDLVEVVADGDRTSIFAAHLLARQPLSRGAWWRGGIVAAMNAQFLTRRGETWDVAPRAHPNDGKVDLVTAAATLSVQQRWLARKRVPLGTHVPHPDITTRQQSTARIELSRSMPLWLDGVRWGEATVVELTVVPDAFEVCV